MCPSTIRSEACSTEYYIASALANFSYISNKTVRVEQVITIAGFVQK